jgi:hypothetical protein
MGIGDNRTQQSPAPFSYHAAGNACLRFPIAHVVVARSRDYEKRPCAERELLYFIERQIEYRGIAPSCIPVMRKKGSVTMG